jgi:hypothetical protein
MELQHTDLQGTLYYYVLLILLLRFILITVTPADEGE